MVAKEFSYLFDEDNSQPGNRRIRIYLLIYRTYSLTPNLNGAGDQRFFNHQMEHFRFLKCKKSHLQDVQMRLNPDLQMTSQSHRAISYSTPDIYIYMYAYLYMYIMYTQEKIFYIHIIIYKICPYILNSFFYKVTIQYKKNNNNNEKTKNY